MFRPTTAIVAPASVLTTLDRLRPYLTAWPAVLPAPTDPTIRPLAVGTGMALVAWLKPETDVAGAALVDEALHLYTRSPAYLSALARLGSQRFALDGSWVGPVAPDHRRFAALILATRVPSKARRGRGGYRLCRDTGMRRPPGRHGDDTVREPDVAGRHGE